MAGRKSEQSTHPGVKSAGAAIRRKHVFQRPEMAILSGHNFPLAILKMAGESTLGARHGHGFHELVIIVSGSGTYRSGDKPARKLEAGDVFLVLPGEMHQYLSSNNLQLINVVWDAKTLPIHQVDPETYKNFCNLFHHDARPRQFVKLSAQKMVDAINLTNIIAAELDKGYAGCVQASGGYLGVLLSFLLRSYHKGPGQNHEYRRILISKVMNYLESHYAEEISREEMAGMLHISCSTFYRYFQEVTGQSFQNYLLGLRMAHGENLLRNTSLSISGIACRVGFQDSNYFITQFKKHFGVPPRKYRASFLKSP